MSDVAYHVRRDPEIGPRLVRGPAPAEPPEPAPAPPPAPVVEVDPELDALQRRAERMRLLGDDLAKRCNQLDPDVCPGWNPVSGSYWRGDYAKRGDYLGTVEGADGLDGPALRATLEEARLAWLHERLASLTDAAERRQAGYRAATQGVARFLGEGRFGLDRILDATRATPNAMSAIRDGWRGRDKQAQTENRRRLDERIEQRKEARR